MITSADQLALHDLMARYIDAVNRKDGNDWIATWTDDATWHLLGNAVQGKAAILATWQQMMAGFEFAIMLPSSGSFSVTGDEASGHWYLHEHARDLQGNGMAILGRYADTYRRVDGQWLYHSRDYHVLYAGPDALAGSYTPLGQGS